MTAAQRAVETIRNLYATGAQVPAILRYYAHPLTDADRVTVLAAFAPTPRRRYPA